MTSTTSTNDAGPVSSPPVEGRVDVVSLSLHSCKLDSIFFHFEKSPFLAILHFVQALVNESWLVYVFGFVGILFSLASIRTKLS